MRKFEIVFDLSALVLQGERLDAATDQAIWLLSGCVVTERNVFKTTSRTYHDVFDAASAFFAAVGERGALRAVRRCEEERRTGRRAGR